MEKRKKYNAKRNDIHKLKSLAGKKTGEYISDKAFEIYLKYEDILTQRQNWILLKLIAINEGEAFYLSEEEIENLLLIDNQSSLNSYFYILLRNDELVWSTDYDIW